VERILLTPVKEGKYYAIGFNQFYRMGSLADHVLALSKIVQRVGCLNNFYQSSQ
jgi:hypothetical protein